MDIMRKEALEEMVRNGRAYRHEIQSVAHELLERRAGRDPTAFDGLVIQVPRTVLVSGPLAPSVIWRGIQPGQSKLAHYDGLQGTIFAIIHRIPGL